jgi:hypothetical protein
LIGACSGGTCHARHYRIDQFQVAWIRRNSDQQLDRIAAFYRTPRPQVIFHIASPTLVIVARLAWGDWVLELGQDLKVGFVQHMRQDVQTAPVRHADQDEINALLCRSTDHLVEHGHRHVQSFNREAVFAREDAVQKALKPLGPRQPFQQCPAINGLYVDAECAAFCRFAQPGPLFGNANVIGVVANR